jgi:3-phosphoshikimate 1-carboxyvinyltransferase
VKSAILLAALTAEGPTTVIEPAQSRDHSERMLRAFGADLSVMGPNGTEVVVRPGAQLRGQSVVVPGDISSAAFWLVAGAITGGGLTVIANAPNPAGYAILRGQFDGGVISPLGLLVAAAPPTLTAILAFRLL